MVKMFNLALTVKCLKKICLKVTILGALSIFSSVAMSAMLCSTVPLLSDSTLKFLNNTKLNKIEVNVDSKQVDPKLEFAFKELTELNEQERAAIIKDLQAFGEDHFGAFSALDFLKLALYHKPSWLKLFQNEFREDHLFTAPVWWSRGFVFAHMPSEFLIQVREILDKILNLYLNTSIAKKANRILTLIRIYLQRPEIALHKKIENKEPLHSLLDIFFKSEALGPSHYEPGHSITATEFGILTHQLNELLKNPPFRGRQSLVYWFGSIPNGRGHAKSDFDFAGTNGFTNDQLALLRSNLKAKQSFVEIQDDQDFTVHELKFSLSNLLFLSPISVAFNQGRIFLVVRELIAPETPMLTYNSQVTILEFHHVRLWHYPVHVTAEGHWSFDESVPVWIEE